VSEDQQIQEAVDEALPEVPSTGKVLAEARERIGLSVADAARQLRLSPRQIEALEADDYARLPGKTFLRGFIRNYARLLQIDPEPLLAGCFEATPQAQSIVVPSSRVEFGGKRRLLPFGDKPQRPWMQILAVAIAAIVIVSWAGYELSQRQPVEPESKTVAESPVLKGGEETTLALPLPQQQAEPATVVPAATQVAEPAPAPAPVAPAPVTPAASSSPASSAASMPAGVPAETVKPALEGTGPRFQFVFNGDSWVEVRDKNGKVLFSQLNTKGSQQMLRLGQPPFSLVVGNAAQVRLSYNDKPIDLTPHTKIDVARLTIE
jgi:cytoskeleton protein RodZ